MLVWRVLRVLVIDHVPPLPTWHAATHKILQISTLIFYPHVYISPCTYSRRIPSSTARFSLSSTHYVSLLNLWKPRCATTDVFFSFQAEPNSASPIQAIWSLLTEPGGETRWGLRYCDVLMFPKYVDEEIATVPEFWCRNLPRLQMSKQVRGQAIGECHIVWDHYCSEHVRAHEDPARVRSKWDIRQYLLHCVIVLMEENTCSRLELQRQLCNSVFGKWFCTVFVL